MAGYQSLHDWNLSPQQAVELQQRLREWVSITPLTAPVKTIAGADISFNKYSLLVYASIVVLELPNLNTIEEAGAVSEMTFPYVPGLLSFREVPALLKAWKQLTTEPDVVMLDGQGIAHPRRIGIASHFGLFIDRPTLGCAKSVLVGKYKEPLAQRGAWTPMLHQGETVGAALRTKTNVGTVFVSPGHRLDLSAAIDITLQCDGGYRIPEPTRRAHNLANTFRRAQITENISSLTRENLNKC
jgi:deoxyribonuclease V